MTGSVYKCMTLHESTKATTPASLYAFDGVVSLQLSHGQHDARKGRDRLVHVTEWADAKEDRREFVSGQTAPRNSRLKPECRGVIV